MLGPDSLILKYLDSGHSGKQSVRRGRLYLYLYCSGTGKGTGTGTGTGTGKGTGTGTHATGEERVGVQVQAWV